MIKRIIRFNQHRKIVFFCLAGAILFLLFSTQLRLKLQEEFIQRVIQSNGTDRKTVDNIDILNELDIRLDQPTIDLIDTNDNDKQNHFSTDEFYSINHEFDRAYVPNKEYIVTTADEIYNGNEQTQVNCLDVFLLTHTSIYSIK